jgi:hypothetical protein
LDAQNSVVKKCTDKTTQLENTCYLSLKKKKKDSEDTNKDLQDGTESHKELFSALET